METVTKKFYENSYIEEGFAAQRRWPNEEFCRFMGRNFFQLSQSEREKTRILEVGCGSGANLRLLEQEKFDGYGIDLATSAIELVPLLLGNDRIHVKQGDMLNLEFEDGYFNAIVDIFSAYCLNEKQFNKFVDEVYRCLKKGGKFFSYTPSKKSQAFIDYAPAQKLDDSTLDGIRRKDSPYYGNFYPFRFMGQDELEKYFGDESKFRICYLETVSRTYNHMKENFEFLVYEVEKVD